MNSDNMKDLVSKLLVGRRVLMTNDSCGKYPRYILGLTDTLFQIHTDRYGAWDCLYLSPCSLADSEEDLYLISIGYAFETYTSLAQLNETLAKLDSDLSVAYDLAHKLNLLSFLADYQYGTIPTFKIIEEK